ncbi:MAG: zinc ribbon domain-containing protein [Clostridia bacterium]|nr:zinc ribbon domain-containing protein [Clostridia bacterium]
MPRTVKEFAYMGAPEALFTVMHQYLTSKGYEYRLFKEELLFKKGVGFWVAPRFIKISFAPGRIRLEGWIKMAALPGVYYGESDLEGFVGIAAKAPAKTDLAQLEAMIQQSGGYALYMPPQGTIPQVAPPAEVPAVNTAAALHRYCPNCGAERVPGAQTCANCGQELS